MLIPIVESGARGRGVGYAQIDEADYNLVGHHKWTMAMGYAQARIDGEFVFMHRLILAAPKGGLFVDHINGDRLDNRRCNLRLADHRQNQWNSRITCRNKTGAKGVAKRGELYRARICANGRQIELGLFHTIEEAHAAYVGACRAIRGEFANVGQRLQASH